MTDLWRLQDLKSAFEKVGATDKTYKQVTEELEIAYHLSAWLRAEATFKQNVTSWLSAEKRWELTQHLIANNPSYQAAEAGWLKMKELVPALDGVTMFGDLAPVLQARYAVFAEASIAAHARGVINQWSSYTDDHLDYVGGEEVDDLPPYCEQCNDYH